MSKLLYIQASPRIGRSHSIAVADAFVEAYRQANPDDEIETVNLFHVDLPSFDGPALQAKYAILHGQEPTPEQRAAWAAVEGVINVLKSAGKFLFAVPMWNFGIPYRLKHAIDLIVQPTYTFSFDPETGYSGLVTGTKAVVVYSRGGAYTEDAGTKAFDQQIPYFTQILAFIGITDVHNIVVEPTLMAGPDVAKAARAEAIVKAQALAEDF